MTDTHAHESLQIWVESLLTPGLFEPSTLVVSTTNVWESVAEARRVFRDRRVKLMRITATEVLEPYKL